MTDQADSPERLHRVRVWFGSHVITDWTGPAGEAEKHAGFMARRFPSLRVINEPVADDLAGIQ